MVRTGILTTAVAIALSGLLFAQGQPQKKDAASQWSFAYAETSTQLVTLTPQPEVAPSQARNLAWAVCPGAVTAISFVPNASVSRGHRYVSAESVPPGTHCLLIDSASHDAMFYWQRGSEIFPVKRACVKGFPQAAEALTGRKVDSCYVIGGYGTGAVELIKYTGQSPKDGLAALLADNLSTTTGDPEYWIAKLPAGDMGWASNDGKFHPEQFQHLFTLIDDSPDDPSTKVRFLAVEWDGPKGAELVLYRPVGNELRPVIVNHAPAFPPVLAENE